MAKVSEVYPSRYVSAADLQRPVTVTIHGAAVEALRNPRTGQNVPKLVLYFEKARKCLPLNATQAKTLAAIAGDDTETWPGTRITLATTTAPNGQPTIAIMQPHEEAEAA